MSDAQQPEYTSNAADARSVRKELHWLEILNFFGQIILAVVGVAAVVIYGRQLHEMKRTNDLTETALKLANANSSDSSRQFQAQLQHFDASLGVTQLQTSATNRLADQERVAAMAAMDAAGIARDTLEASVESAHRGERAWIGISSAKPTSFDGNAGTLSANMQVAFTVHNYGHSAAENIRFLANLESDPTIDSLSCDETRKIGATMVLLPSEEQTMNWVMKLDSNQITKGWSHQNPALGKDLLLRIVGCIEYSDRDNEAPTHRTPFSYIVQWTRPDFITVDKTIPGSELLLSPLFERAGASQVR